MILGPVFEQFSKESPLRVMSRATIEYALSASFVDSLFERTAERGYTKELLFSTTVDLMSLVVCGRVPPVQSAYNRILERVPVTLECVYEKLQHLEPDGSAEMVRAVAGRCQSLIPELGGACKPLLPGYRVRILDGNHLAATQKRLKVTRGHSAGPLPGQSLAVLDPALRVVTDIIPCEEAHTQERALSGRVLPLARENDLWIEDRNFCTVDFLLGVLPRRARFLPRRHGNPTVESQGEFGPEFEAQTGWVSERRVWVCRDGRRVLPARLLRVRLKQPAEDGDTEVELLTNLPAKVKATKGADSYLKRWKIEGTFHELTVALNCEGNTLGYPKAALFGFCTAVVAYNVLAVLKAALRAVPGEEEVQQEVSGYYLALGWGLVYAGMMIALPAGEWEVFGQMSAGELAGYLRVWASQINLKKIKKAPPRQPTKEKPKRSKDDSPHLSTARLLEEARTDRQTKQKVRNQR